jgi:hypothetical protein
MKKETLESELQLLLSLPYTQAYTGNLEKLQQKSYVEYSEILKLINERRERLQNLKKDPVM